MITPQTLGDTEYQTLRYKIIKAAEAEELLPYIDPRGLPTIGPGFLLWDSGTGAQASVREAVYRSLGFKFRGDIGVSTEELAIEAGYMGELTAIFRENWVGSSKFEPQFVLAIAEVMNRRSTDSRLSFPRRENFAFDFALDADGDNREMKEALGRFIPDKERVLDLKSAKGARLELF